MNILFLGAKNQPVSKAALTFLTRHADVEYHLGEWGQPLPQDAEWWRGDLIVSVNSRWILPEFLLKQARLAAINFHPAPPEYPGIGGLNWALYEGAKEYGVTCHHMAPVVDSGRIIRVVRFPVLPSDDVESLLARTHAYQLALIMEVMAGVFAGGSIPASDWCWAGRARTRGELNALSRIFTAMPQDEVERRIRATAHNGWMPYVEVCGWRFSYRNNLHSIEKEGPT